MLKPEARCGEGYIKSCNFVPNRPVLLFLRLQRALTARLATHSKVESPIRRLKIPNSTSRDPAPAVQVSLMLSGGTPVFRFTWIEDRGRSSVTFQSWSHNLLINRYLVSLLWVHNSVTHPRVRNACAGVLKGRQQADGQVMSQVKQLIIVTFKAHLAKRMFWVRQQDVRWDKASQDPSGKGEHVTPGQENLVKHHYGKIFVRRWSQDICVTVATVPVPAWLLEYLSFLN